MFNLSFVRRALVSRYTPVLLVFGFLASNSGAMGNSMLPSDVLQLWQAVAGSLKRP